ncbi:MAG: zinc-dependent alcohol dehydrogenase family protein, partial [Alphaproteobacteria bacterium]|nr:zinc-dependent alcohol dehydrogenase family protein [Alphaproteobacteria bacterium]
FGEPAEVLRVEEAAEPSPGPGEVAVRMELRPINPADLLTVRGLYGTRPRLPAVPGYEGVGHVVAVGADVTAPAPGARVVPLGSNGTWQQVCLAKAAALLPVPDSVPDESAAQFVVNPMTALAMVGEVLATERGDWLLQTAAGSTLGRIVLQLARVDGFRTVNLVRRAAQIPEIEALGGDLVLAADDPDLAARVAAATAGAPLARAIDAVGGATGAAVLGLLSPGGTMVSYGMLSGAAIPVDPGLLVFRGLRIEGFWLTRWMRHAGAERRQALVGRLGDLMGQGLVAPPVAATYPIDAIHAAVTHAERAGRSGKVLVSG